MSSQRYQNKTITDEQTLDEVYQRLNQLEQRDGDNENVLANNLTRSIKSLSRKWLQEAYLDGMMLADNLHRITSQNKPIQNLNTSEVSKPLDDTSDEKRIALAVQKELQKLGLVKVEQKSSDANSFANITVGLLFILGGFFIIGGAIGFYGLDKQIANYASSTLASLNGNSNNTSIVENQGKNNPVSITPKVAKVNPVQAPAQTDLPTQNQTPTLSLPIPAANAQNLTSPAQTNQNTQNSSQNTSTTSQNTASNSSSLSSNTNPNENLPASCNGQKPILNRPLNIQNPNDRAILYCILDLQSQNQSTNQNTSTTSSTETNQNGQSPNPSQIPQR